MTMKRWGRGLLIWGLFALALSLTPFMALTLLPPGNYGFFGLVATLLALSVAPVFAVAASAGAILLLVAVLRRDPF